MRQVMEKEIIESVVNINCGVCGQKFRMGEEVRQTITGKLGWIKDVDDDGLLEWRLAIVHGEIADVHTKCLPIQGSIMSRNPKFDERRLKPQVAFNGKGYYVYKHPRNPLFYGSLAQCLAVVGGITLGKTLDDTTRIAVNGLADKN